MKQYHLTISVSEQDWIDRASIRKWCLCQCGLISVDISLCVDVGLYMCEWMSVWEGVCMNGRMSLYGSVWLTICKDLHSYVCVCMWACELLSLRECVSERPDMFAGNVVSQYHFDKLPSDVCTKKRLPLGGSVSLLSRDLKCCSPTAFRIQIRARSSRPRFVLCCCMTWQFSLHLRSHKIPIRQHRFKQTFKQEVH